MNIKRFTPDDLLPKDNHNIIENLPAFIKNACNLFSDPVEQNVFFYSALGVLSGCLPYYISGYDGNWVSPHIYVFILAPYGTGKGTMSFARYLGMSIHKTKRDKYKRELQVYLEAKKQKSSKGQDDSANSAIPEPLNYMLYIPADNSKSALVDAINENGHGIIFETEGDTLAAALKQEYGTFMDILLKAFHHETIAFMRRQNKENKEVERPRLAMVLSSTYDQHQSFIRSAENGLVSRFAYYLLPENKAFRNVFEEGKDMLRKHFEELGKEVEQNYNYLYCLDKPLTFIFTMEQKETFNKYFSKVKEEADGFHGSINRLALMTYRIAMILAYFRYDEYHSGQHPREYIKCTDKDFTNAMAVSMVLQENAEAVHALLPQRRQKKPGNFDELYTALPDEFTTKDVLAMAKEINIAKRKAERFLEKDERIERVSQGNYKKK